MRLLKNKNLKLIDILLLIFLYFVVSYILFSSSKQRSESHHTIALPCTRVLISP